MDMWHQDRWRGIFMFLVVSDCYLHLKSILVHPDKNLGVL